MERLDLLARLRAVDDDLLDDAEAAADSIGARRPRTIDDLRRDLIDASPHIRVRAASALGRAADPATTTALRQAAGDLVPAVRAAALAALVRLSPDLLLPEIVKALRGGDARVVTGAAVVLGRAALLGAPVHAAAPNLVEAFKTDDPEIGAAVAWALGCMGEKAVVPWLVAALEQGFVPQAAAEALGRLADPRAQPTLLAALAHEDERVRAAAARALGRLPDPPIARLELMLIDSSPRVRLCAALALYEGGEDPAPLSRALDEKP